MPQTITEKIIAAHAGRPEVKAGDSLFIEPDLIIMSERTGFTAMKDLEKMSVDRLHDPSKIVVAIDHTVQGARTEAPIVWGNRQVRLWCQANGIEKFFDVGKGGLRHQVSVEKGLIGPGMLCMADEPNLDNMGVLGALHYFLGKDVWEPMATGDAEIRVPETLRIVLNGALRAGVTASDLGQRIRRDLGGHGGIGTLVNYQVIRKIAEFDGPGLATLSIDSRMDLLGMYPIGMGIMNPDQLAIDWARAHGASVDNVVRSDPDATFEETFAYDLGAIEPQVTLPPSVRGAVPIGEIPSDIKIDQAVVGSCANGRLDDLRKVAQVLRGRKIHRSVRMFITPITQEIYSQAAREGLLEVFAYAGAVVTMPSCGTCWGYIGFLAEGESCVTTTQHNYPGRMGSADASIYIASPYTVAASALEGRVVDPRPYIQA